MCCPYISASSGWRVEELVNQPQVPHSFFFNQWFPFEQTSEPLFGCAGDTVRNPWLMLNANYLLTVSISRMPHGLGTESSEIDV
jgi:hypothetical protein